MHTTNILLPLKTGKREIKHLRKLTQSFIAELNVFSQEDNLMSAKQRYPESEILFDIVQNDRSRNGTKSTYKKLFYSTYKFSIKMPPKSSSYPRLVLHNQQLNLKLNEANITLLLVVRRQATKVTVYMGKDGYYYANFKITAYNAEEIEYLRNNRTTFSNKNYYSIDTTPTGVTNPNSHYAELLALQKSYTHIVGIDRGEHPFLAFYKQNLQNGSAEFGTREQLAISHLKPKQQWNKINHYNNEILAEIVQPNTLYVLEKLGILSAQHEDFENKLIYRANKLGSTVLLVNPDYTSQYCPNCGTIEKTNRNRKQHIYECRECGYTMNDDVIAAENLAILGQRWIDGEDPEFTK